jgi:hypothetical protein
VGAVDPTIEIEVFFARRAKYDAFLSAQVPPERAVFFIRNKAVSERVAGVNEGQAAEESGYNMLINLTQSLFRDLEGRVHVPDATAGDFTSDWEGRPFAAFVEVLGALP